MKILFLGTISFSKTILESLIGKYEIAGVISQPNRIKKKGVFLDTEVAKTAKDNNLKLFQPENISDIYDELKELDFDLLVSAAYGQYVPSKIIKLAKISINVHGSLLPKYRGGAPIQRALMNGDKITGITLIEMAKKLDSGKIFAKEELEIIDTDTADTLFDKLAVVGARLLNENIDDIYLGNNKGYLQNEDEVTYAYNITKEEEKIDFSDNAINIVNKIKGLSKNPGAYFTKDGIIIKIYDAHIVYDDKGSIGEVMDIKGKIIIRAKDYQVSLDKILISGKKEMDAKSFSNGQKIFKLNDII